MICFPDYPALQNSMPYSGLPEVEHKSSDVDISAYQEVLEGVLAWLLEAEECLKSQGDIATDVQQVKDQFHKHEVSRLQSTRCYL